MCTVLLPPGGYPIAVNKYIILHIIYHIISYHIYCIVYYIIYHIEWRTDIRLHREEGAILEEISHSNGLETVGNE
jgi:hypothetical protein